MSRFGFTGRRTGISYVHAHSLKDRVRSKALHTWWCSSTCPPQKGYLPILCISTHFFLPPALPSSFRSQLTTLPNITTPFPSMKATRERPSQFLKVSHTNGCCGWKEHSAISLDFNECGSSIFLPPVSFPIFHLNFEIRQADLPQRTKPIGE